MDTEETHRNADRTDVEFETAIWNDAVPVIVRAEILETEEGYADVESLSVTVWDVGIDAEYELSTEELALIPGLIKQWEERAIEEWESQR
jgi:hypothetical protein